MDSALVEAVTRVAFGDTSTDVLLTLRGATEDLPKTLGELALSLLSIRADAPGAISLAASILDADLDERVNPRGKRDDWQLLDELLAAVMLARHDPAGALDKALRLNGSDRYPTYALDATIADCASRLAFDTLTGVRLARSLEELETHADDHRSGSDPAWALLARRLVVDAALRMACRAATASVATAWLNIVTGTDVGRLQRLWVIASIDSEVLQAVKIGERLEVKKLDRRATHELRTIASNAYVFLSLDERPVFPDSWHWSAPAALRHDLRRLGRTLFQGAVADLFDDPGPEPVAVLPIGTAERLPIGEAIVETAQGTHRALRRLRPLYTPLSKDGSQRTLQGSHRLYLRGERVTSKKEPAGLTKVDAPSLPTKLTELRGGVLVIHAHGSDDAALISPSTASTPDELAKHVIEIPCFEPRSLDLSGWGVVVMSCGSGRVGADGALVRAGLVATLLERGAAWVVASPWLVIDHDDSTQFVEDFLDAVSQGAQAATALADTQHRWQQAGSHPLFWISWRVFR